ncbi:MAG: hypothetical protein EP330_08335 [Deltaproteobacteria bacterium]|nr:MAG: hypothetical protein EP330_08335 [Deltaproteobacteria bacterium]
MRPLRRRDFLKWSVLAVGAAATAKIGSRALLGVTMPSRTLPELRHLSPRQAATVTAAALAMVGPAGERAYEAGEWEPALGVDDMLGGLAADQRDQLGVALVLFEEWAVGPTGFSSWTREAQRARLAAWRTSSLGLHQSVWGFLHAATTSSFGFSEAGWRRMDYPGPCVGTSRAPGQTATFEWDEAVP